MHTSFDRQPPSLNTSFTAAISVAAAVLLGLAIGGSAVVTHVKMAPSAVPAELAVSAKKDKQHRHLTTSTHQRLKRTGSGPTWTELSKHQRDVLKPLKEQWNVMSEITKRRWMTLSDGFDALSADDQDKLRKRMQGWSNLSAQQRNQARLNFFNSRHHSPDELQMKWAEYQALTEEEKQRLAAKAAPKPKGAAPILRPPQKKKLARVPAANSVPPSAPNLPKIPPHTPLPPSSNPALQTPSHPTPLHIPTDSLPAVQATPIEIPRAAPVEELAPLAEDAPVEKTQPQSSGQYSHPDFPLIHPPQ